ncbi:DUF1120 domain-containing protein [Herbaspirillum sp. alder98]|uniref:DUF1120 domain-containing protein n=1 Tax=Herbaspirillum sp. alder98 TaxID=2913096 RepID=UPI001CD87B03|nr:DUF1120 domain-containing protein [Herbaspirillum sp. alder98]MCA1323071.1 DUF1120 domain-containing protein [Herbaspirillum sp. alder98]
MTLPFAPHSCRIPAAFLLRFFLLLALACHGAAAHALPSVELKVKGTVRPSACTPSLSSDGVLDYGVIAIASLNPMHPTVLPIRDITLTVDCREPASIALAVVDNRAMSRVFGLFDDSVASIGSTFGLGMAAGYKLGGYRISFDASATADGQPVSSIMSSNKGLSWRSNVGYLRHTGHYFGFSQDGATLSTQKVLNAPLRIQAVLNSGPDFPRGEELQLDGSATIELKYL